MKSQTPLTAFDMQRFNARSEPVIAILEDAVLSNELPLHTHPQGQLVFAHQGFVTCDVASTMWMAAANSAIWIPAETPHCNRASDDAKLFYLFIQNNLRDLPTSTCTLSISPLLKEMILHLTTVSQHYKAGDETSRLVEVLLDQLQQMPLQELGFPMSENSIIQAIAKQLIKQPDDRKTLAQWAHLHAMSERTLARLVKKETGLSFGKWRSQLHVIVALQLLSQQQSVQHISEKLGYESVSAFITMFKKALSKSPKRYMKELAQS
ncbi:helix-turn-helix transcriptional regulator [Shewanella sp. 10N.7]|uniref:AraC family transcriptional regulator n=1 Tax=Shewanella sp. 10N.7 TaxID=2885093 RepID=UPI001E4777EC|nr:helix-turn-helix transcriptional regulator [Shewanella sp. 10N.7]MCC4834530.1 helix-turn-helix transcriptional regulator [Shewanella sp. 10N.7]